MYYLHFSDATYAYKHQISFMLKSQIISISVINYVMYYIFISLNFCSYRRVRTLYACVGENDSELSFEPNQIIYNGKPSFYFKMQYLIIICC